MPVEQLESSRATALAHKRIAIAQYAAQLELRSDAGDPEARKRARHARAKIRSIDADLAGTPLETRDEPPNPEPRGIRLIEAERALDDVEHQTEANGVQSVRAAADELQRICTYKASRHSDIGPARSMASTRVREPQTYTRHAAVSGERRSYIADLVRLNTNSDVDGSARVRLMRHATDVATLSEYAEYRDLSRVDGAGGYGVPPSWLMDQYVDLARPGRAMANLVNHENLPSGTDSINIPKLMTGTAVDIQASDNAADTQVDLTDSFVNAPVRTLAGQQSIAIQLIDQSPIAFDQMVFRDLVADHASQVDRQVIRGTGSAGQVLGVDNTAGTQTVAVSAVTTAGVYSAIANAVQLVHTTRFLAPEVIVMHPRRWGWFLSLLDGQQRPLFLPAANRGQNLAGVLSEVASQQVVGQMHGLPVVTDPNITTTAGTGSPAGTEDVIYVMRASDITLWESPIKSRVLPETKGQTLTVVLQAFSYLALTAGRFPQSIVQVGGLSAPSF